MKVVNAETKQTVLYPNDPRYIMSVDKEFQDLWQDVRIPDDVDLEKEMSKANLQMMKQEKSMKRPAPKQKKQPKARKIKLTNIHVKGIDLTQDYIPQPQT